MLRLILGALLLWQTCLANAQVTKAEAALVYKTLAAKSGLRKVPPLFFSKSLEINAQADGFGVTINQGMLDYLANKDELALVLGHELAHIRNGDIWKPNSPKLELVADTTGAKITHAAGYSVCNGLGYRMRRYNDFGNEGGGDHPSNSVRLQNLQSYCRHGGG